MKIRTNFIMIGIFVLVLITAAESQYFSMPGFKPDITFGDHNDRFDVKPLIKLQNKYYSSLQSGRRDHREDMPREHNRREWLALEGNRPKSKVKLGKMIKHVKKNINKEFDSIGKLLSNAWRRSHKSSDTITPNDKYEKLNGSIDDFVSSKTLNNVFINLGGRRSGSVHAGDNRRDAIFNYAFPIQMVLRGYLLAPPLVK